ncbi:MAG: MerR family transcriptional regulator [Humidesulfovibrio sp.]|nr:MerR family transcriptional regulator [Humidesulfovibrio sp.]
MDAGSRGKTYKIGQAAKLLDVKPFVLRYWESEFKSVLKPVRTPAGQRAYTEANVATVREIKRLLYDEGLTIEGAKKRLVQFHEPASSQEPDSAPDALTDALTDTLRDIQRELQAIRDLLGD